MKITRTEKLAWCAGLADGEGCWMVNKLKKEGKNKIYKYNRPRFEITQNDRRVLDRFLKTVKVGKVHGPWKHSSGKSKPYYRYVVNGIKSTKLVTNLLFPWLSPIKQMQVKKVLLGCSWNGLSIFPDKKERK